MARAVLKRESHAYEDWRKWFMTPPPNLLHANFHTVEFIKSAIFIEP